MKKLIVGLLVLAFLLTGVNVSEAQASGRGGFMGFIAGCCFGIRAAGDYNQGKEIHWREWVMLIPYVNIVFAIWNGIDGANGVTKTDLAAKYGAMYY
jgi:hypothetical protein